jgi:8-oxo-dGTP pyrophosphatase MutT (NUDIX family)
MSTKGSCCVVINDKEEVLLVLREDFRIWTLPGGGVEAGETWEQAAIRETLEETGHNVTIRHYVGEYWRPQLSHGEGDRMRVFVAQVTDGSPEQHDKETVDVRWFPATALPTRMFRFAREHLQDALAGLPSPVSKEQRLPMWMAVLIRIALKVRDFRKHIFSRKMMERKNDER